MDGAVWVLAGIPWAVAGWAFARRRELVDRVADHLEGRHEPPAPPPHEHHHITMLAPRPLPRGDCGLFGYRGGDDAA